MMDDPKEAAAFATTSFALSLYRELAGPPENLFLAPAGIFTALTMAWLGAQGETDAEIERALHLLNDGEQLRAVFEALAAATSQSGDTPGCNLAIANALWVEQGFPLYPDYVKVLRERLGTSVMQANFSKAAEAARQAINAWAEAQTKGSIRDVIPPGSLEPTTVLVLANAIFFKGSWADPFDAGKTRLQPFRCPGRPTVHVMLMHGKMSYPMRYYEDLHAQALALPYAGGALEMIVLLPVEHGGLPELERRLDTARLLAILRDLRYASAASVDVYLPRFRIETTLELNKALQRLGIQSAFDRYQADFSGITPHPDGLYISAALQKAMIDVNEEGTVAAAVSIFRMAPATGIPPRPDLFRADHPFMFLIQDTRTGTILFLGRLFDPASASSG